MQGTEIIFNTSQKRKLGQEARRAGVFIFALGILEVKKRIQHFFISGNHSQFSQHNTHHKWSSCKLLKLQLRNLFQVANVSVISHCNSLNITWHTSGCVHGEKSLANHRLLYRTQPKQFMQAGIVTQNWFIGNLGLEFNLFWQLFPVYDM